MVCYGISGVVNWFFVVWQDFVSIMVAVNVVDLPLSSNHSCVVANQATFTMSGVESCFVCLLVGWISNDFLNTFCTCCSNSKFMLIFCNIDTVVCFLAYTLRGLTSIVSTNSSRAKLWCDLLSLIEQFLLRSFLRAIGQLQVKLSTWTKASSLYFFLFSTAKRGNNFIQQASRTCNCNSLPVTYGTLIDQQKGTNEKGKIITFVNTELRRACASSETIDLRTLEFGLASTRCPSTTSKRVTDLHILVPAITRGTLARPHGLKIVLTHIFSCWSGKNSFYL